MKAAIGLILVAFAVAVQAVADVPRAVFRIEQLAEAKAKAAADAKPLIFVYTDPNTSCPLCLDAAAESFKVFRSLGVVLLADTKNDRGDLPSGAVEMLGSPKAGNTIPIVLVTTADGAMGLEVIPYKTLSNDARGAARDLRKTLEGVDVVNGGGGGAQPDAGNDAAAEADTSTAELDLLCEEREWVNAAGQTMRAAVIRMNAVAVTFKLANGKIVDYPLARLSDDSREEILKLAK